MLLIQFLETAALVLGLVVWLTAIVLTIWGTFTTIRHLNRTGPKNSHEAKPVSILKPVKGAESGLEENLESFFRLDYFRFELLFSLADANDPARPIIEKLISKYPRVRARLTVGDVKAGANPKVNNLIRSYEEARHDWILISDSNVRVKPDYLKCVVDGFTPDVGIVTAFVCGSSPKRAGGWLEAVFLNTFYARWMMIATRFGNPVVIGKSMLFRKSEASRFGGLTTLARYLAEDYMAGQAMRLLGKRVSVMHLPVQQPIGEYSLKSFWLRHLRWGRIRKSQAPPAFFFEPLFSMLVSGLIGAVAAHAMFAIDPASLFAGHVVVWFLCDLLLMKAMAKSIQLRSILAWAVREILYYPLWLHIASGRTVLWRGHRLQLARGGMLKS